MAEVSPEPLQSSSTALEGRSPSVTAPGVGQARLPCGLHGHPPRLFRPLPGVIAPIKEVAHALADIGSGGSGKFWKRLMGQAALPPLVVRVYLLDEQKSPGI